MPDRSEMPIGFVSRSGKELFTIRKGGFSLFLWCKAFSLIPVWPQVYLTDTLTTLFDESKIVPAQASSRIQRWALSLASYQYTISF